MLVQLSNYCAKLKCWGAFASQHFQMRGKIGFLNIDE